MFDFLSRWPQGLSYDAFLDRHASPDQRRRWEAAQARRELRLLRVKRLKASVGG